jgi:alkanesulfonate monooxygenase SsuD/methylene tetrahydromethanopterin reductase-like flavin-dependent oxidoreductase (luciferase family)
VFSFHLPPVITQTVAQYRAEAARAGWEPILDQVVYRGFVVVADTDERAAELEAVFLPARLRFLLTGSVPDATGTLGLPLAQCRPCISL